MSGETETSVSGWTVDTLHELMVELFKERDHRYAIQWDNNERALVSAFEAQEKSVNAAFEAAQEAVTKAETAAEKRFDSVNEFRAQLADQASTFMPRAEVGVVLDALANRMDQQGLRMGEYERRLNLMSGSSAGTASLWGYLVGAGALFAAIAATVIAFTK